MGLAASIFQSTHPLRGATRYVQMGGYQQHISIHAPLAGCDPWTPNWQRRCRISIHAPLAGCDLCRLFEVQPQRHFNPRTPCGVRLFYRSNIPSCQKFQSTHPLRGATRGRGSSPHPRIISIHAPLAGCDPRLAAPVRQRADFNPRTPCGVRPRSGWPCPATWAFQSTHPLRGATPSVG